MNLLKNLLFPVKRYYSKAQAEFAADWWSQNLQRPGHHSTSSGVLLHALLLQKLPVLEETEIERFKAAVREYVWNCTNPHVCFLHVHDEPHYTMQDIVDQAGIDQYYLPRNVCLWVYSNGTILRRYGYGPEIIVYDVAKVTR